MVVKEVFTVREYTDNASGTKKSSWTRIGAAFTNKDGSLTIKLEALPLDGRLQVRDPLPKKETDADSLPF